jgi:hypothetical protein
MAALAMSLNGRRWVSHLAPLLRTLIPFMRASLSWLDHPLKVLSCWGPNFNITMGRGAPRPSQPPRHSTAH